MEAEGEGLWTLRIRTAAGAIQVQLAPTASCAALKSRLARVSTLALTDITVRAGFPPKALELVDEEPISQHIANFETLIVSKTTARTAATTTAATTGPAPGADPSGKEGVGAGAGAAAIVEGKQSLGDVYAVLGEDLAKAVAGGAGNTQVTASARAFRTQLKSALRTREAERLAGQRVEAALLGGYEFLEPTAYRLDGSSPQLRVRFQVSARKWCEEEYGMMPLPILKLVVLSILKDRDYRENLKPMTMAQVSPRVFWNIVKEVGPDVEAALRGMLPTVDWSFLEVRIRQLSQRGIDYKRFQEMERQGRRPRAKAKGKGKGKKRQAGEGEEEEGAEDAAAGVTEEAAATGSPKRARVEQPAAT